MADNCSGGSCRNKRSRAASLSSSSPSSSSSAQTAGGSGAVAGALTAPRGLGGMKDDEGKEEADLTPRDVVEEEADAVAAPRSAALVLLPVRSSLRLDSCNWLSSNLAAADLSDDWASSRNLRRWTKVLRLSWGAGPSNTNTG
jgi:hypothetical protein